MKNLTSKPSLDSIQEPNIVSNSSEHDLLPGVHGALRRTPTPWWHSRAFVWYLAGGTAFLYLGLFIVTGEPIYRNGDQLIYLENAVKMFDGQTIYRDFFQFTPPGTEFLYVCLFKLVGVHVWVPSVALLLLGVGFLWLSAKITSELVIGADVFLPGLLFLTCAYFWWLDGTHHWYSSFCVMAALATVINKRSPARLGVAGALCGLALCFTQLRGLMAILGLCGFVWWEYRRGSKSRRSLVKNEACALGSFLAVVAAFNGYFAAHAGLRRFLWCTITFGVKYYPAWPGNTWRMHLFDFPRLQGWSNELLRVAVFLFINSIVPIVWVLFFVRYRHFKRLRPVEIRDRLMLVSLIGAALFVAIAPAPGDLRESSISLPALILLIWLLHSWGDTGKKILRALWVAALALVVIEPGSRQIHWQTHLDLPLGRMAFLDPLSSEVHHWLLERTKPSEFFFEEEDPRMNFTLDLRNPTPVPFVTNTEYTRPEQVLAVIQTLAKHRVHFVMVSPFMDLPIGGRDWGDHLAPLRTYLATHYHPVKTFSNGEQVWERN